MLLLLLVFIVLPIAEIYVIVKVGEAIGILPTLALLIVDGFVGAALARRQGAAAWQRFNEAIAAGRTPAKEVLDGAMVIVGGAFLLAPGFITDVIGLLLLVPPTRALLRGLTTQDRAPANGLHGVLAARRRPDRGRGRGPGFGAPPPRRQGYDYEGTAREIDETELPPPSDDA